MTHIGILYGTSGGNTKIVCQKIASVLEKKGLVPHLHRVVKTSDKIFDEYQIMILASPTYAHGELDPHIIPFYERLEGKAKLTGKYFGVVGLGDDLYDIDYNIESAYILKKFVLDHDGEMILEPLLINKSPLPHLETTVSEWADRFVEQLKTI